MKVLKKVGMLFLLITMALQSATIDTAQYQFQVGKSVPILLTDLPQHADDWVGIYPKGASNDWENIVDWSFTNGIEAGTINFDNLPAATYEARIFFSNSFTLEGVTEFKVEGNGGGETTIATSKASYQVGESIDVTLTHMAGNNEDWVGIYQQGASNDWANMRAWSFTNGIVDGSVTLDSVPAGNYEVRAFFNNSFDVVVVSQFKVEGNGGGETTITTSKASYQVGESIDVTLAHMAGNNEDWVGIYQQGASNDWANMRAWSFTNGIVDGSVTLDSVPAGDYEVRVFFNNSFDVVAVAPFKVEGNGGGEPVTMYEDGENGGNENWSVILGDYEPRIISGGFQSQHLVELKPHWINAHENTSEYWLYTANDTKTILEMDIGGIGRKMPHFFIGVQVLTQKGERSIIWDSYFNHAHVAPFIADYGNGNIELGFPSPVEHVRGWGYAGLNVWSHFRVDIQAALKQLEPDNTIISIKALKFSGGFLDNIKLSAQ